MSSGRHDRVSGAPATPPPWVRKVDPPPPPELHPWLSGGETDGAGFPSVEELERRAEEALSRSRTAVRPDGALHLLAADAYLTWACEAALEGARPDATLAELAERVAGGGGSSGSPKPAGR